MKGKLQSHTKLLKRNWILLMMLLPAVVYVVIFNYLPMPGVLLAFKKFNYAQGIFGSPWSGLENFRFFFSSGDAARITFNTFFYNLSFIILEVTLSVTMSILLSELLFKRINRVAQSLMFLPHFVSWVVVSALVYSLINYENGTVQNIIIGMGGERVNIYSTPKYWPFIISGVYLWKVVGYQSVVYLAAITSLDQEITDAAKVDGANVMQRIFHIILPQLIPTVTILVLLSVGRIFRGNIDLFYQLVGNNGTLFPVTDVIDTYVFRSLIRTTNVGMAAAAGLYQSVLCFVIVMITNWFVKKVEPDYALF